MTKTPVDPTNNSPHQSKKLIHQTISLYLQKRYAFAVAMWLSSRSIIFLALLVVAPLLPAPPGGIKAEWGWDVFSAWDSNLYQLIVKDGYDGTYGEPGAMVAFFPLFPLAMKAGMTLGLSAEISGTIINNLAFLGALIIFYDWVAKKHGDKVARWATAVLAWNPLSLFCSVVYTEGVFLLFSTAALRAFDNRQYISMTVWSSLATATRVTGLALITAFVIASWREKRKKIVYLAAIAGSAGVVFYSFYCWLHFGDPLAFINVQHTYWQRESGFDWQGWTKMLMQITIGNTNWQYGAIKNPWHPLLFSLISSGGYLLWRFRHQISAPIWDYSCCALLFFLWLIVGDPLLNAGAVLGGIYVLWRCRQELSWVALVYGWCGIGLLLVSGGTISLNRLAYGIVSLNLALGILFARYHRWGYSAIGFFTLLLISFSVRFAQHLWVA